MNTSAIPDAGPAGGPAVVLLSGGVDSTTLLHHVVRRLGRAPVHALSFDYGQRHARELEQARWQARAAGVTEHRVLELAFLGELLGAATSLTRAGAAVPDLDAIPAADRAQPPTYVPNRNMILLALAAAYAESRGVDALYYGAQRQDEYGYWDCTIDFLARINDLLSLNRRRPVTVHAPFMEWHKVDVVREGLALGVDFSRTWTCYRGGGTACGRCPSCVERAQAFARAGVPDPLSGQAAGNRSA